MTRRLLVAFPAVLLAFALAGGGGHARAAVARPALTCGPISNSLGALYNDAGNVTTTSGSPTNWCPENGGAELVQSNTVNKGGGQCIYANPVGSDNADLYVHVCNSQRDADQWKLLSDGCLENEYVGYGSGYCASGYPLGNIVNMYLWNGTGPEIWTLP
jgi:hypothetical protein